MTPKPNLLLITLPHTLKPDLDIRSPISSCYFVTLPFGMEMLTVCHCTMKVDNWSFHFYGADSSQLTCISEETLNLGFWTVLEFLSRMFCRWIQYMFHYETVITFWLLRADSFSIKINGKCRRREISWTWHKHSIINACIKYHILFYAYTQFYVCICQLNSNWKIFFINYLLSL